MNHVFVFLLSAVQSFCACVVGENYSIISHETYLRVRRMLGRVTIMSWFWYVLILPSFCLAILIDSTLFNPPTFGHQLLLPKLDPRFSLEEQQPTPLVPISLGPVDENDEKRVNGDCKVPMRHDGYLWHRVREGLWFQATGYLEVEDDNYTALSNRLECDPGSLSCELTINSVVSVTASETWGESYSVTFGIELEKVLTLEASITQETEHSIEASVTTSAETSYSCTVSGNKTVYLAARIQYYLVFGYVSEYMIVRREFYVDDDGNIRERNYWGWEESCLPFYRIPKVQFDRSVAGTRRCVTEDLPAKTAK